MPTCGAAGIGHAAQLLGRRSSDPSSRGHGRLAPGARIDRRSPFTVEATPISSHPGDTRSRDGLVQPSAPSARHRRRPARPRQAGVGWMKSPSTPQGLLARNLNGIGRTGFIVEDLAPAIIDHRSARRATNYLDVVAAEEALRFQDPDPEGVRVGGRARHCRPPRRPDWQPPSASAPACPGGMFIWASSRRARGSNVGEDHKWSEVLQEAARLLVSGVCHYNTQGILTRTSTWRASKRSSRATYPISDLRDPQFHRRKFPAQHLRLVWGDEANG